ncbi:MAG: LCP family protein [Clostridia bacterium]|nr:LCP family protein [Clostridia bacterium]
MRKLFALMLVLILLPVVPVFAEETELPMPTATLTPEEWAKQNMDESSPLSIDVVPYDELPPVVEGQHHYLLLCIDQWVRDARPDGINVPTYANGSRKDMYGNTDGIVLLTLDTRAHRIMLTSFIRDALIKKTNLEESNGDKYGRINRVYNDYGPEVLCQIISQHIGVKVEKYILFTFKQIANIVDYLGGVDIELTEAEIAALKYTVLYGTVTDPNGHDLQAGGHHPAGVYSFKTTPWAEQKNKQTEKNQKDDESKVVKRTGGCSAVLYMRIRKFGGGGDFMRTQRARKVLSLLADKCRTMTWDDARALANNVLENNNKTNMNLDDMIQAAEYAFSLRECTIEELRIPMEGAVRSHHYAGMATQEINWPYCREQMADYLQNSFLVADDEDDDDF